MKIHKSTGTNVTRCGRDTRGLVVSDDWDDVDCTTCRKAGKVVPKVFHKMINEKAKEHQLKLF